MEVPAGRYTPASFRNMLVRSEDRFRDLREVSFLTKFQTWGEGEPYTLSGFLKAHNFQIESYGEIRELKTTYKPRNEEYDIPVNYFAYLNPRNRTLTCFTEANSEVRRKTINPLAGVIGMYFLWISPTVFDEIKEKILANYPFTKIPFFFADRESSSRLPANFRPDSERSFSYRGEDGRETLEELRHYYGVIPRYIEFRIPGLVDFSLNHLGVFHYKDGSLEKMFAYSEEAAEIVLQVRRILEESKLEFVNVETRNKRLKVQNIIPWEIHFKRDLEVSDAESLFDRLKQRGFAVYNDAVTAGSVYFDATVFDEKKSSIFSVSSTQRRMTISPRYNTSFDSFLRFFESITEDFDPEASCRAPS